MLLDKTEDRVPEFSPPILLTNAIGALADARYSNYGILKSQHRRYTSIADPTTPLQIHSNDEGDYRLWNGILPTLMNMDKEEDW